MHNAGMRRDAVIGQLRAVESLLRARGVHHAALFGSVARGDESPESDIDILVDLDANVVRTVYDYVGIKHFIAGTSSRRFQPCMMS